MFLRRVLALRQCARYSFGCELVAEPGLILAAHVQGLSYGLQQLLYCATTNPDKVKEFKHALGGQYEVRQLRGIAAPDETGETFEENAEQKALYYSRHSSDPVFVDDSGLEVDALNGAPGVHSARYAGEHASSAENNALLLERMHGIDHRSARFVCVIALAQAGKLLGTYRGTVEGEILKAARGGGGFGYDPLFYCPVLGCTFGEASLEQKSGISARGNALRMLASALHPIGYHRS